MTKSCPCGCGLPYDPDNIVTIDRALACYYMTKKRLEIELLRSELRDLRDYISYCDNHGRLVSRDYWKRLHGRKRDGLRMH